MAVNLEDIFPMFEAWLDPIRCSYCFDSALDWMFTLNNIWINFWDGTWTSSFEIIVTFRVFSFFSHIFRLFFFFSFYGLVFVMFILMFTDSESVTDTWPMETFFPPVVDSDRNLLLLWRTRSGPPSAHTHKDTHKHTHTSVWLFSKRASDLHLLSPLEVYCYLSIGKYWKKNVISGSSLVHSP